MLTYVAVGASAGGLDALRALFAVATHDPHVAYVVITHLPVHHVSHLAELLDRAGPVPTVDACSGEQLGGGHVYAMPPGRLMGLHEGKVFFDQVRRSVRPAPKPIDFFMASLAEDVGARCVGVVLSGTDHDGTVGLKAIRAVGGLTIVQAPDTAEFPSLQDQVFQLFHFALNPGGLLWLGKAQTLGSAHSALFEPVAGGLRLVRRIGGRSHFPRGFALQGSRARAPWRDGGVPPSPQAENTDPAGAAEPSVGPMATRLWSCCGCPARRRRPCTTRCNRPTRSWRVPRKNSRR